MFLLPKLFQLWQLVAHSGFLLYSTDILPSLFFFERFLTFWHFKMLQAHLVFFMRPFFVVLFFLQIFSIMYFISLNNVSIFFQLISEVLVSLILQSVVSTGSHSWWLVLLCVWLVLLYTDYCTWNFILKIHWSLEWSCLSPKKSSPFAFSSWGSPNLEPL